ncbi:hypothetical protein KQI65_15785 [bacterium]|nr:hypothetical protein [bacterium]
MTRIRVVAILSVLLLCAGNAFSQVDDVTVEFSSGKEKEVDIAGYGDGMLTTVEARYVGEWNKTRLVDTVRIGMDSVRALTFDEGSTVFGTFLPVTLGSGLLGIIAAGSTGGLGGGIAFIMVAGLGTIAGLIAGLASASDPEIYSPAVPHDAAALEYRLMEDVPSDVDWKRKYGYASVRELVPQLEFSLSDGREFEGRLLEISEENVTVLVEESPDTLVGQPNEISIVSLTDLSHVSYYGNISTAPWGTLLLGGGGLLALTLATSASDGDLMQNMLLTVGPGLLLDIGMGLNAASPSWEWDASTGESAVLEEYSLQFVLEHTAVGRHRMIVNE